MLDWRLRQVEKALGAEAEAGSDTDETDADK